MHYPVPIGYLIWYSAKSGSGRTLKNAICCIPTRTPPLSFYRPDAFLAAQPHTHACTHYTSILRPTGPRLPRWDATRTNLLSWILLKQETVSGSGISWTICESAPRPRQITMPAPHQSVFLQARCPSSCPMNSIKALMAVALKAGWCSNINQLRIICKTLQRAFLVATVKEKFWLVCS